MRAGLLVTTGLCAVLALAAGCGGKGNSSTTAIASTDVHESASAAPTATAGPTAGPTPGGPATVPAASSNNKSGYAWIEQATTASYTLTHDYKFSTSGGAIHEQRVSVGNYVVTFDGIGVIGGIAHASSYGTNNNYCNVTNWHANALNEVVSVQCFAANATPIDTQFLVNFASRHSGLTRFSYLWADQPSNPDYEPNPTWRYDSTGATPKVKRTDVGRYRVYLPASADPAGEPYLFQVTAYDSSAHCKITGAYVAAATHQIYCWNASGFFVDSKFEVTFAQNGSIIGRDERRYGEYTDTSPGIVAGTAGVSTVPADEMGAAKGQVIAFAEGGDSTYCHTGGWGPDGSDMKMVVRCFNIDGSPNESQFRVMVTW